MNNCLLIKIKDNRKFLVQEKHLQSLIEFAKTFNAEIFQVSTKEKTMSLEKLATAICNPQHKKNIEFEKIKKIYPEIDKNRSGIIKNAAKINKFIRDCLLSGEPISLKDLKNKYKNYNITDSCLCNHLNNTRKKLIEEGYEFVKVGAGKYCLLK